MNKIVIDILKREDINRNHIEMVKTTFPIRYKKALGFKFQDDFLRSIASSYLILKHFPFIKEDGLKYNEKGKPYIEGKFFNISHSGDYIIIAISSDEVGCDIENAVIIKENTPLKAFNEDEIKYINKDKKMFYQIWTKKESILKLFGTGLTSNLNEIDTIKSFKENSIMYKGREIFIHSFEYDNHFISVSSFANFKIAFLDSLY